MKQAAAKETLESQMLLLQDGVSRGRQPAMTVSLSAPKPGTAQLACLSCPPFAVALH